MMSACSRRCTLQLFRRAAPPPPKLACVRPRPTALAGLNLLGRQLPSRRLISGTAHGIDTAPLVTGKRKQLILLGGAITFLSAALTISLASRNSAENLNAADKVAARDDRPGDLPRFRVSDIRHHGADSDRPWVIHGDKVYDITDWVAAHPGGDVILRAAGSSVEPYWDIFSIHKSPHVIEILNQYLIGYVDAADLGPDGRPALQSVSDPFISDPARDPRLVTLSAKPRSAETPAEELTAHFLTPSQTFFVRNHMWVPVVKEDEADAHTVTVQLPDGTERVYTLSELKRTFAPIKVTSTMQCSGNRRSHMTEMAAPTNGLQWGVGGISNAEWEGVRLADVLAHAAAEAHSESSDSISINNNSNDKKQPDADAAAAAAAVAAAAAAAAVSFSGAKHVQFSGLETYGASIPLSTALDPRADVLLAWGMNGAPLPRDHGYPLRAVVPGHVGARSVKWLNRVVVSDEESPSQWQRRDYKCFGPNQTADNLSPADWDAAPAIQEMPVTSAISRISVLGKDRWIVKGCRGGTEVVMAKADDGQQMTKRDGDDTKFSLMGYAYSGGGKEIVRVDVSLDGGRTWNQARLLDDRKTAPSNGSKTWSWKRWQFDAHIPSFQSSDAGDISSVEGVKGKACLDLVVKATDEAYNTQPQSQSSVFNSRGNLATAWQRLRLCPECVHKV